MPLDEVLGYQASTPMSMVETTKFDKDDEQASTIIRVYNDLKEQLADIDAWHAFNLDEKTAGLTIKQQIAAHKIASEILNTSLQTLQTAVETINQKFMDQQEGNQ